MTTTETNRPVVWFLIVGRAHPLLCIANNSQRGGERKIKFVEGTGNVFSPPGWNRDTEREREREQSQEGQPIGQRIQERI